MRMRSLFALIHIFLLASMAHGGTGISDFVHHIDKSFDYHMARPNDWEFRETRAPLRGLDYSWLTTNANLFPKPESSWVQFDFFSGFPAATAAELLAEITRTHSSEHLTWTEVIDSEFAAFESSKLSDGRDATLNYRYYLVNKNTVVKVAMRRHASGNGAHLVDMILKTIHRASIPPHITKIGMLDGKTTPYRVGDHACYGIWLDQFRDEFDAKSLTRFHVRGNPEYWNFWEELAWLPDEGILKVCVKVRSSFGQDALIIDQMELENTSGKNVLCQTTGSELVCQSCRQIDDRYVCEKTPQGFAPPPVENPAVDREGPELLNMDFNSETEELKLTVREATGILGARIFFGEMDSIILFADDFHQGAATAVLKDRAFDGWNKIERIIFFDVNGLKSELRIPQGTQNMPTTYEWLPASGTAKETSWPIITFLHHTR